MKISIKIQIGNLKMELSSMFDWKQPIWHAKIICYATSHLEVNFVSNWHFKTKVVLNKNVNMITVIQIPFGLFSFHKYVYFVPDSARE